MESTANMVYLEDERLAREAQTDTEQKVDLCPDCGAQVIVRIHDEINHGMLRGICRCLCGAVWEVEMAA